MALAASEPSSTFGTHYASFANGTHRQIYPHSIALPYHREDLSSSTVPPPPVFDRPPANGSVAVDVLNRGILYAPSQSCVVPNPPVVIGFDHTVRPADVARTGSAWST